MSRVANFNCTRMEIESCDLNCLKFDEWGTKSICPELEVELVMDEGQPIEGFEIG
jgi:hypothetical protein